jgi:hypothetical protein
MKRSGFVLGILIILLLTISFASADVGEAQTCLRNEIQEKTCEKLTTEEKAFSLLADSKCKTELVDDSRENECWPKTFCKTKTTAQAILALNNEGVDTQKSTEWLLAQAIPPSELEWFLQIDSSKPTTCQITYDSQTNSINIGENSKIKSDAGRCLLRSSDDRWLKVKPTCFRMEFEISCDEGFSTSLFYQKKASPILYVSGNTKSSSALGTTKATVNSDCFKSDETLCDYEATLWSAVALKQAGKPVIAYLPYLNSMSNENELNLPESFLYKLTSGKSFYDDLSAKQNPTGYWEVSGNNFYDTAVALYSMQSQETTEKTSAISWLIGVQGDDGCWGSIRDTAFLIHAGWGESLTPDPTPDPTPDLPSCSDLEGERCSYGETCDGRSESSKEGSCCLGDCKTSGGGGGDIPEPPSEPTNYLPLLLIIGILIVLVIIGIIFKDKLRPYWFRLKSKFSKGGGSSSSAPMTPPGLLPPATLPQQTRPRRIIPRQAVRPRPRIKRKPKSGPEKEFSDVLKKLKDMGN